MANRQSAGSTDNAEVDITIDHSKQATETVKPTKTVPQPKPQVSTPWHFQAEDASTTKPAVDKDDEAKLAVKPINKPISWSASEFIEHRKSVGWYFLLIIGTAILAGLVYLLTHDKVSSGVIIVAALVFGIYANRKPRTLDYTIEDSGVSVGNKKYRFGHFKSFAIVQEGAFSSIVLLPLKRFSPLVSIFYDPKDESQIIDALSNRLPLDDHRQDVFDHFLRKIRY